MPPKKGGLYEYESHAAKHRKNLDTDRLNDLTIICSDSKQVRCQSYMLRVASDVFDDMLIDGFQESIIAPRFSSSVMERVKHYCHLGQLLDPNVVAFVEMGILLDSLIAADYYHIDEFGAHCLERVTKVMGKAPNLAFVVISKFGVWYQAESRPMVASAIDFARNAIGHFELRRLNEPFIGAIAMVRDRETLSMVLELIPMINSRLGQDDSLLPLKFMEKWVSLVSKSSLTFDGQVNLDPTGIANELLRETNFLLKIAALRPNHLIDGKGMIRQSMLFDVEAVEGAIYSIELRYSFVESKPPVTREINIGIKEIFGIVGKRTVRPVSPGTPCD
jgi:BTB/POZ domain